MRIIIVGGGVVGFSLAEHLLNDGHNLTLIELDPKLCKQLSEKLDMQIINGSGSSPKILKEAGIKETDMVLAVTPNDEVNIVVCSIANLYNVPRRIARLRDREFSEESEHLNLEKLGITSVIHPEKALVDHIVQFMNTPHAVESANFENGKILLRGYYVTEDMELANKTPMEIRQEMEDDIVLFAAIAREGKGMIPSGDTVIEPGDILYTLFPRESLDRFLQLVNIERKKNRKIIITGNSYATLELAQTIEKENYSITLIDADSEHAKKAAHLLSGVQVIEGDATDADILKEMNVDNASFFISISDAAEYNMFSSILAKAEGAHEVIAISTESRHDKLFNSIGIDHVINPRLITAREILEIVSRGQIGAAVKLTDVDIEAIRFTVEPGSFMANSVVKRIARKLKKGSIIGVVVRGDKMIIPNGETIVEADDHVIMITRHKNIPSLSKLFKTTQ